MSPRYEAAFAHAPQLVGDPVDTLTGANLEVQREFELPGPLPFLWRRHYDSRLVGQTFALGVGHTHSYDYQLRFDLDGLAFAAPLARPVGFPPLFADGDGAAAQALVLRRLSPLKYSVRLTDRTTLEFEFTDPARPARLRRLRRGDDAIAFEHDHSGSLERIVDSFGRSIRVTCTPEGYIASLTLYEGPTDQGRSLISYAYDSAGNLVEGRDGYGSRFRFAYDSYHRVIARTDRRGYTFHFTYDELGRCIRSAGEDGLLEYRFEYNVADQATRATRGDGGRWLYHPDANGVLTKIVDPYEGVRTFVVDEAGQVAGEIDESGNPFRYAYDEGGELLGAYDELGRFRAVGSARFKSAFDRQYAPRTPVEWEQGADLAFSSFRLVPVFSLELGELPAAVRRYVATTAAQPVRRGDRARLGPPPFPGRLTRDLFGLIVAATDPADAVRRWQYDANGNVVREVDESGGEWRTHYGSWNLVTRTVDPLQHAVTYRYTATEQLEAIVDAGGTATQFQVDLKDRRTSVERHGVVRDTYGYDGAGLMIEHRDGTGATLRRITPGVAALPATVILGEGMERTLVHDEHGRLVEAVDDAGALHREFDELGNHVTDLHDGVGTRRRFDLFDVSEIAILERFRIEYRKSGGQRTIIDPTGKRTIVRHLVEGAFLRTLGPGRCELAQYDWRGRCLVKVAFDETSSMEHWARQYSYDPVGTLAKVEDSRSGRWDYVHDAAHRLTEERAPWREPATFSYDAAGNVIAAPGLVGVTVSENRLLAANGSSFTYGHRSHVSGRRTATGVITFEYDAEDRLVRCRTPAGEWSARYDALGRRISKTWRGAVIRFLWDGERLAAELWPNGGVRVYVYVDAHARVPLLCVDYASIEDDPRSGQRRHILANQIGCPVAVEDDAGKTLWRATIAPYGRADVDSASEIRLDLRFPGHYADDELGLHYNRHRYYSPELCRYLQSDPIDIEGGVNVYAYTSRPLTEVDLDGLACPKDMVLDPADQAALDKKKEEAVALAQALREQMDSNISGLRANPDGTFSMITKHEDVTLAVLVVQRGKEYDIVVASSHGPGSIPAEVRGTIGDRLVVPPRVGSDDARYDRNGDQIQAGQPGSTHRHAEQRGLRWADSQDNVDGVASVTPSRPCCGGCSRAISERGDPGLDSVEPIPGLPKTR